MKRFLLTSILLISINSFSAIAHVKSGAATSTATAGVATFTYTPNAINNVVLIAVGCASSSTPSAITLTSSGWTITAISGIVGSSGQFLASFWALVPNTSLDTFTVTWTGGSTCGGFTNDLIDEFSGTDTTAPVDANNSGTNTSGGCTLSVIPANNNDAVWFGCNDSVTAAANSGYTKGADDASQDVAQYKILSGGSGISQTSAFTSSGAYVIVAATLKASDLSAIIGIGKQQKLEKLN